MPEIKLYELQCPRCGGQLNKQSEEVYKCGCCGKTFERQTVTDVAERLRSVMDEQKQEAVANLRRQLWQEMHAQYINSARVVELARDIKKYLPEDYFANFCETANSANDSTVNAFLTNTSKEDMADYADIVLDFMLKSAKQSNLSAVSLFIERAFKGDPANYDKYTTKLEEEAEKVNKGVYDLIIPRDVFLAYSSADIDKVIELCDYLESNKISCFLALRNLRHGRGAVDNYDDAIKTAIDNCKTVVFVSSGNSRSMTCDALTKELPYIKQKDIENAPAEFRFAYDKLPAEYAMPRVEYLIEDYSGGVGEALAKEFFHGLEWCKSKEAVAFRVSKYITATRGERAAEQAAAEAKAGQAGFKYCKRCRAANKPTAKYCASCGSRVFYADYDEYINGKYKYCANCGAQNNVGDKFCAECGSSRFFSDKSEYSEAVARREAENGRSKARGGQPRGRQSAAQNRAPAASGTAGSAKRSKWDDMSAALNRLPLIIKMLFCLPFVDMVYAALRLAKGVIKKDWITVILALVTIYPGIFFMWLIDLLWVIFRGHAFLLGAERFQ